MPTEPDAMPESLLKRRAVLVTLPAPARLDRAGDLLVRARCPGRLAETSLILDCNALRRSSLEFAHELLKEVFSARKADALLLRAAPADLARALDEVRPQDIGDRLHVLDVQPPGEGRPSRLRPARPWPAVGSLGSRRGR